MKEISEEKAIDVVRQMVADGQVSQEVAEKYFPELAESEDERIRKGIIRNLGYLMDRAEGFVKEELKERIAWLERRGQTFTKKDVDDAYLKGVCDAKHELEKQGKNNMGISEATKQKLEDNLNKALEKETPESWNKFLDEQKPVWSEEDELHIRELESLVKQVWATAERENDKDTIHKMSDLSFFLKTLKPQLKQEWSEEDEAKIVKLKSFIAQCKGFNKENRNKAFDLIDSIKPKHTWKPSDEQMENLSRAFNGGSYRTLLLMELYQDLKKLKG